MPNVQILPFIFHFRFKIANNDKHNISLLFIWNSRSWPFLVLVLGFRFSAQIGVPNEQFRQNAKKSFPRKKNFYSKPTRIAHIDSIWIVVDILWYTPFTIYLFIHTTSFNPKTVLALMLTLHKCRRAHSQFPNRKADESERNKTKTRKCEKKIVSKRMNYNRPKILLSIVHWQCQYVHYVL